MLKNILVGVSLLGVPFAAAAQDVTDMINRVAPYTYPANKPKAVAELCYMPDGLSYLQLSPDGRRVTRYDTSSGKELEVVFNAEKTRNASVASIEGITLSDDGKKLLVYTDSEPIYRRSFRAKYYVFEIGRNILTPLSEKFPLQQAPLFSPDGRMVAFVVDNNIYIKKLDYNNEVAVTNDGAPREIINGVPDWSYEEEFSTTCSMTWAPDNSALSFVRYDETEVPVYNFALYEGACDPQKQYSLYPGTFSYKYPVAGKPNSKVSVHCYDISNRTIKKVALDENVYYIPRIAYAHSPERLMVVTLNRDQNEMILYSANPKSTVARNILTERSKAWITPDTYEDLAWLEDGFVMHSTRSGYNHIYLYSYAGALKRQLTSGDYNVTDYYGADATGNHYYQCTSSGPINRVVSRVDAKGAVTPLSATEGWAQADFAPSMNYYILNQSSALTPPVYTLCATRGKDSRILENNDSLARVAKTLPSKEFFQCTSDGVTLNGYMVKPLNFNPSRRYPVIMWQYSGPDSQEVTNRWAMDWQVTAALDGFVVVCVDGRGTGGRDRAFAEVVYRDLGRYETIDQLNAARYIASQPWAGKIGLCGWSYGGYETLMAISANGAPYAAAVAIAPVTDWRFYDTIYTERYMLTPQQNEDGYRSSAPIHRIDGVKCPLLMMHGTADDNVHLSNTMEYVARLIERRKPCDMLLFPNMNHSIKGCDTRAVVYGKMLQHFKLYLND